MDRIETPIPFECSFCSNQWSAESSEYKKTTRKSKKLSWIEYRAYCPSCGRQTTTYEQVKKVENQ